MKRSVFLTWVVALLVFAGLVYAAVEVPTDIQQPGTQPQEVSTLESPDKCDNCHGGYNALVEPDHNWRGSMMANAGRDPIFWATLAVAEQDFDGAGDLCIRCHSTAGWLAGRSTPTDGSGLGTSDGDGVECDFCHKMTNPDDSEHLGEQFPPFVANDGGSPAAGYYGSGMASMWGGSEKLGPYVDAEARHQFLQSNFHRSREFCGTCHDVSNPAVGDLAHNNGAQLTDGGVIADGTPFTPVDGKAAFNNFPFQYGVVERTFSEYMSGDLSATLVSAAEPGLVGLPEELKAGAIQVAYESAIVAGQGGDYADGSPRYFTCQTCHMRPVEGAGCNKKGAPVRTDLPLHDMTGGNYWMPEAIKYLDPLGKLRLGGGLNAVQSAALDDGITRAKKQLNEAVALSVDGNTLKVINLTGHKVISGYPEGRRMWLNINWYDAEHNSVGEYGAYGPIGVFVPNPADGTSVDVESILDLHDPNTRIYEAHYGMTKEWADQLMNPPLNVPGTLCLSYDRGITASAVDACNYTLADLAAQAPGTNHETFHFVLNNTVVKDNRIPPYGFKYDEAAKRNALPVPADQYGPGTAGSVYDYFDEFPLVPPEGTTPVYATIDLLYQPTSWEYIQFLWLANNGQNAFLADEGINLLEAWLNTPTKMAAPYVMASTTWGTAPVPAEPEMWADSLSTLLAAKRGQPTPTDVFKPQDSFLLEAYVVDEGGTPLSGAQVFVDILDEAAGIVVSLQGFSDDAGIAQLQWKIPRRQAAGSYTGNVKNIVKSGYVFNDASGQTEVGFTIQ